MKVNKKFTIFPFITQTQATILSALASGSVTGTDLLFLVSKNKTVTKQGLYKALRGLLQAEILVKEKGFYSYSLVWLQQLTEFVQSTEIAHGVTLPQFVHGSKAKKSFYFSNAAALDIYWGHLFLTLCRTFPGKPIFFFNHHAWPIYFRPDSEKYLYNNALQKTNVFLITLGKDTSVAREFKRTYSHKNIQVAIQENLPIKKNQHMCIVDDYLITTTYEKAVMDKLDTFFADFRSMGENESKVLYTTLELPNKSSITIIKDAKKALLWKRRLAQSFAIKKTEL